MGGYRGADSGLLLPSSGCREIPSGSVTASPEPRLGLMDWRLRHKGQQNNLPPALLPVQVAGVHSQALPDLPDGTLDLEQLELAIREAHGSRYHPRPELICLENTHSSAGGRALPLTYLQQVGAASGAEGSSQHSTAHSSCAPTQVRLLAERYGLRVHMDGARLMNAAVAQDVEPARIAQHCDSVSLCFSKVSSHREPGAGAQRSGCRQRSHRPPGSAGPGSPGRGRACRAPGICGRGLAGAEAAGRRDAAGGRAGGCCPHRVGAGRGNAAQRPRQCPPLCSR